MVVEDKIYGVVTAKDPVFAELSESSSLQRLKGVTQQGMPRAYYHQEVFSRFDHSVGVFLLLRRLEAGLEEQVAGLLHDVSHTAFSHVVDWVIGDPSKEDHQDSIFSEYLKNSEIPAILGRNDLQSEQFYDLTGFSLLERELPSLCADRIDYALREMAGICDQEQILRILEDLTVEDDQIVFRSAEVAEEFGQWFAKLQREHWAGDKQRARYYVLSRVLKTALSEGCLSRDDFFATDQEVMDILESSRSPGIKKGIGMLRKDLEVKETGAGQAVKLPKKFRYVDPEVLSRGRIKKLSSLSGRYRDLLVEEQKINDRKNMTPVVISWV